MSKLCKNCGKELNDDVKFCNFCGFNQANEPPNPAQAQQQASANPPPSQQASGSSTQAPPPAPKPKGGCLKKMLYILAGLIVVALLLNQCGGPSKSQSNTSSTTKPSTTTSTSKDNATKEKPKTEPAKPKKASIQGQSIKAETMLQDFIKNQDEALEKYKFSTFKINGKVLDKEQYNNSNSFYTIIGDKKVGEKRYIIGVSYSEKQVDKVNQIKIGDFLNVEVECMGIVKQKNPNDIYIQLNAKTLFDF